MMIGACTLTLRAPWVQSLKEKRMIVKSILEKTKNRFNVSIAEVDKQDNHDTIVLGFACVSNESRHANNMIDTIIRFIEGNCEAEIVLVERELL